jgi:predicted RNA-binding protein
MCQATVYLGDQVVAREVTGLERIQDGVRLVAFFEEPVVVPGRIRQIDFLRHRVLLEPLQEVADGGDR